MSPAPVVQRFLLDQSVEARLRAYLRFLGHDAVRVGTDFPPGLPDPDVLALAVNERRILITDDRDFGELVFRPHGRHRGAVGADARSLSGNARSIAFAS